MNIIIALYAFYLSTTTQSAFAQNIFDDPARMWAQKRINIELARKVTNTNNANQIIIAVIDTGIDFEHPDLKNALWTNKGETGIDRLGRNKETNGVDDDQNGYIDDLHGWNFAKNNNDIQDNHGHGTHISGIIAAQGVMNTKYKGIFPQAKIMVLKYFDTIGNSGNSLPATIDCVRYATKMGAQIINYSGGGTQKSFFEEKAIREASVKNILFISAAGNESASSDEHPFYPANYGLSNILSVTAIDPSDHILNSSNYGSNAVDLAAPGKNIYSTLPKNSYGYMTGTSQATAVATGMAALILANRPDLKVPSDLISHLKHTSFYLSSLRDKTNTQSRVDAARSLAMQNQNVTALGLNKKKLKISKNDELILKTKGLESPQALPSSHALLSN